MTDDQDFFFDEEDTAVEAPAEKPAKASAKSAPKVAAATSTTAAVQTVTTTVAALIGVVALLAGVIVGILLPIGDNSVPSPTTTGASSTAPQLSEEELQSGTLPEGHPDISGMSGGEATGTAGGEATTTAP